jgi:hypothetical protein
LLASYSPSSLDCAGGTALTLSGSNLCNASSVTVGGAVASITSNSATSIVVTAPAGSGSNVLIVVTTPSGTSNALTINYSETGCTNPAACNFNPSAICDDGSCIEETNWVVGDWSVCTEECGGGIQTRTVVCQDCVGNTVSNGLCAGVQPATTQTCNTDPCCENDWVVGDWSVCTEECGGGIQTRAVVCQDCLGNTVSNGLCAGVQPATTQTCNTDPCCENDWVVGDWSVCTEECGGGIQTRAVVCQDCLGNTVSNGLCAGVQPATTQVCNVDPCCENDWVVGEWGECSVECGEISEPETFWTEGFGLGCNTGQLASGFSSSNGFWTTTTTGTNDTYANTFFISSAEQMDVDGCGIGCGGSNSRTLHLSNVEISGLVTADNGASYNAGGICGFGICVATNIRAESPTIDCSGRSDIELTFDYVEFGQGTTDNATLWYFDGTTWSLLQDLPKTNCCGGPCNGTNQASFTGFTITLPVSANNNSNVRIGFNWTNNDDGVGTDPSFAVDNISLVGVGPTGGIQTRIVECRDCNGNPVLNELCTGSQPANTQVCNTEPCPVCEIVLSGTTTSATIGFANGSATVIASNGVEPYTYLWNDSFEQTLATAMGLFPGAYTCLVTDANDCTESIELTVGLQSEVPQTQVRAQFCNTAGYVLNDVISCDNIIGSSNYRWEFTPQGGSPLPEYTRGSSNYNVRLSWVSGTQLGVTYEVRVKAFVNGQWGEYGPMCTITTTSEVPLTEVHPNWTPNNPNTNTTYGYCGVVAANGVAGAAAYGWELTGPNTLFAETSSYNLVLSSVAGLQLNTTYQVRVRLLMSGSWGEYGPTRPINLGMPPATVILASLCNTTRAINQAVAAVNVCGAQYTFRFQHPTEVERTKVRNVYTCPLWQMNPALTPGETYQVSVSVTQGGISSGYGVACPITIAGPQAAGLASEMLISKSLETGSMVLFPNPNFGGEVRLMLESIEEGAHNVNITVYDIFGKQISTEAFGYEGAELSHVLRFNSQLATGIYTVHVVIDGNSFAVERMVVK